MVELVGQVVVGPGHSRRNREHHRPVEQVGPDEVQRQPTRRARQWRPPPST
jgi:hypothetical protein